MAADLFACSEVDADGARICVGLRDPAAVIRDDSGDQVVAAWPDLDVGLRSPSVTAFGSPTGAWVLYRPMESEDERTPEGRTAAVHVAPSGAVTRFEGLPGTHLLGVSRHGLWLAATSAPRPRDHDRWLEDCVISVLGADGSRATVSVDRRPAFVLDDGGTPLLVVHEGPPRFPPALRVPDRSFIRRYCGIELPPGALPAKLNLGAHPKLWNDDERLMRLMAASGARTPVSPPEDPGVRWQRVRLSAAQGTDAVATVREEFHHLDVDRLAGGERLPSTADEPYDASVVAVGLWPETRVEVSFRLPHYPARLRRTLRVFDDAGRVSPALYASVHLQEDLATRALPSPDAAVDGVVEF